MRWPSESSVVGTGKLSKCVESGKE
jgi:hypothetical protein